MSVIKLKMHQLLDMPTLLEFVRLESAMQSGGGVRTVLKFDYPAALPDILKGIPINMEFYNLCTSAAIEVYYSYSCQHSTLHDWVCDKLHWTPEFLNGLSLDDATAILRCSKGVDLATMLPQPRALQVAKQQIDKTFTNVYIVLALLRRRDLPADVRMQLAKLPYVFSSDAAESVDVTLAMLRFSVEERIELLNTLSWTSKTQGAKAGVLARKLQKTLAKEAVT
jgi:hypothetical protein